MVTVYGMNKEIGNLSFFDSKQSEYAFNKPYSEATAERIDKEVKGIIDEVYARTRNLLLKHQGHLEIIAKELLEKEILFQADLERLIGKRPFEKPTTYEQFTNGTSINDKKVEPKAEPEKKEAETEPKPTEVSGN